MLHVASLLCLSDIRFLYPQPCTSTSIFGLLYHITIILYISPCWPWQVSSLLYILDVLVHLLTMFLQTSDKSACVYDDCIIIIYVTSFPGDFLLPSWIMRARMRGRTEDTRLQLHRQAGNIFCARTIRYRT